MEYLKEIVHYFKDSDIGIGLDLDPENKAPAISSGTKRLMNYLLRLQIM